MYRFNNISDTEIDLICYELERLGYYYIADSAGPQWRHGLPYPLQSEITDHIPLSVSQAIGSINARISAN